MSEIWNKDRGVSSYWFLANMTSCVFLFFFNLRQEIREAGEVMTVYICDITQEITGTHLRYALQDYT